MRAGWRVGTADEDEERGNELRVIEFKLIVGGAFRYVCGVLCGAVAGFGAGARRRFPQALEAVFVRSER